MKKAFLVVLLVLGGSVRAQAQPNDYPSVASLSAAVDADRSRPPSTYVPGQLYWDGQLGNWHAVVNQIDTVLCNVTIGCGGSGGGGVGPGTSGQLNWYQSNGSNVVAFTLGGDCSIAVPNISCTKTGGTPFAASATTDATNAGNISAGTLNAARLPATVFLDNQSNTVTTGTQDFSAVSVFKMPVAAAFAAAANGSVGYDTTNKMWHGYQNGADAIFMEIAASASIANGDCTKFSVSSNVITLADAGAACGSGGGGGLSGQTAGAIPVAATSSTSTSSLLPPNSEACSVNYPASSNTASCTPPGIVGNNQTSSYPVNVSDRGKYIFPNSSSAFTLTLPTAGVSGSSDYNFYGADFNVGSAAVTIASASSISGDTNIPQFWLDLFMTPDNATWRSIALPSYAAFPSSCPDTGGNHVNVSAGVFSCGTSSSGGGGGGGTFGVQFGASTTVSSAGDSEWGAFTYAGGNCAGLNSLCMFVLPAAHTFTTLYVTTAGTSAAGCTMTVNQVHWTLSGTTWSHAITLTLNVSAGSSLGNYHTTGSDAYVAGDGLSYEVVQSSCGNPTPPLVSITSQ